MASNRRRQLPPPSLVINYFCCDSHISQFRLIENKLGLDPALRQPHMCKCVFAVLQTLHAAPVPVCARHFRSSGMPTRRFRRYNEFLPEEDRTKVEMSEDGHGLTLFRAIEAWLERAPFVTVAEWSFLTECARLCLCESVPYDIAQVPTSSQCVRLPSIRRFQVLFSWRCRCAAGGTGSYR